MWWIGAIFLSIFLDTSGAQDKSNCTFYNHMVKNKSKKELVISLLVPVSCDIIKNFIIPYSDIEAIGRLGQTCKDYYQCYCDKVVCKIHRMQSIEKICTSLMCHISARDFDANTDILAIYAKKYKKSQYKDTQACVMFEHLWHHHAPERMKGVADVLEIEYPTMQQCLQVYAGDYDRSVKRCIKNEKIYSLKERLFASIGKANVKKIECFVEQKNIIAIKTMLLTNLVLYTKDRILFLEKLYALPGISIIKKLYSRCTIDWHEIIMCALFCKKYEPVFNLIQSNRPWALHNRFKIWKTIVCHGLSPLYPVVDLLFADDINALDLQGYGLLYYAVNSQRLEAVQFLLNKKIKVNQVCNGETALQRAIDSSEITSLLLQHDAHINSQDKNGYTPLMSIMLHSFLRNEMESVLDLLLKYGADVNILTDNNDSVFHMLALSGLRYDVKKMSRVISLLIEYGAIIDIKNNQGNTALDCAVYYKNVDLITILTAEMAKKELKDAPYNKAPSSFQLPAQQLMQEQADNTYEKPIAYHRKVFLYSFGLTISAAMGCFLWQWLLQ